jgi:hypothetical protein
VPSQTLARAAFLGPFRPQPPRNADAGAWRNPSGGTKAEPSRYRALIPKHGEPVRAAERARSYRVVQLRLRARRLQAPPSSAVLELRLRVPPASLASSAAGPELRPRAPSSSSAPRAGPELCPQAPTSSSAPASRPASSTVCALTPAALTHVERQEWPERDGAGCYGR